MKGGMKCLLENLNDEKRQCGDNFDLLYNLGELWSEFMREIIPTLQVNCYCYTTGGSVEPATHRVFTWCANGTVSRFTLCSVTRENKF